MSLFDLDSMSGVIVLSTWGGKRLRQWGTTPYVLLDAQRFEEVASVLGISSLPEVDEVRTATGEYLKALHLHRSAATHRSAEGAAKRKGTAERSEDPGDARANLHVPAAALRKKHRELLASGQKAVDEKLFPQGEIDRELLSKVSPFFQLDRVFRIECPKCQDVVGMSEYTRIFAIIRNLQGSFEARRCRWLFQAGALHNVLQSATHTRHAHMIGTAVAAVSALLNIVIYPSRDVSLQFGEYCLARGFLREFVAAAFVHDLGHPPLSHVLERNPFVPLDHEEITRSLVRGGPDCEGKPSWYALSQYLQRSRVVGLMDEKDRIAFFEDEPQSLEETCDVRSIHDALHSAGVDPVRVSEFLRGTEDVGPAANDNGQEPSSDSQTDGEEALERSDLACVRRLLDSPIDLDRIDHVRRDSAVCGLSLSSFRVRELLQGLTVVYSGSDLWENLDTSERACCFLVCPQALMYLIDMLGSRALIFREVLFSDDNNFMSGVVNQLAACAVRQFPHLRVMLPFVTDQVLAHIFTHERFSGTEVAKLNRLLQGKADTSCYHTPRHFQIESRCLWIRPVYFRDFYVAIECMNEEECAPDFEIPAVIVHVNLRGKEPKKGRNSSDSSCVGGESDEWVIDLDKHRETSDEPSEWPEWLILDEPHDMQGQARSVSLRRLVGSGSPLIRQTRVPPMPSEKENDGLVTIWIHRALTNQRRDELVELVRKRLVQALKQQYEAPPMPSTTGDDSK